MYVDISTLLTFCIVKFVDFGWLFVFYSVVYHSEVCLYKNISLFFITRKGRNAAGDQETDTGLLSFTPCGETYSEPQYVLL